MTLAETVHHIQTALNCDLDKAVAQLRDVVRDGEMQSRHDPSKYLTKNYFKNVVLRPPIVEDVPPSLVECGQEILNDRFWEHALIVLNHVVCEFDVYDKAENELIYRPTFFLREDILRHWPITNVGDGTPASPAQKRSKCSRRSKREVGRPTISEVAISSTLDRMRDEGYPISTHTDKELATEVARRNAVALGTRGWSERTVRRHVSDWRNKNPAPPT